MKQCECTPKSNHVNAYVDLNGVPYVLAEYLDHKYLQQVDRSVVKSEVFIDESEAMRAIVDISVDDIGKRASDGLLNISGNKTKQKRFIQMVENHVDRFNRQLPVLKRGIVVRINYQLENIRTGQTLRTMSEDFRILDRTYFLDINPRDIEDPGIVVNFCDSKVSTVNDFTHGIDKMMIRVTSMQMMYEMLSYDTKRPRITQSLRSFSNDPVDRCYGNESDYYKYHEQLQSQHYFSPDGVDYPHENTELCSRDTRSMFNRFYHFDHMGKDIVFHGQEITDPMTKTTLIPCGTVQINRTFVINPGHRIIFKFCIWKNDITCFQDSTKVCQALKVPYLDTYYEMDDCVDDYEHCEYHHQCHPHHHYPDHTMDPNVEHLTKIAHQGIKEDQKQNFAINQIMEKLTLLTTAVEDIQNQLSTEPEEPTPPVPDDSEEVHNQILSKINELTTSIEKIQEQVNGIDDSVCVDGTTVKPYPPSKIEDIVSGVEDE